MKRLYSIEVIEPEEGKPEPERIQPPVCAPVLEGCQWHAGYSEATLPMQLGDVSCPECKRWWRKV